MDTCELKYKEKDNMHSLLVLWACNTYVTKYNMKGGEVRGGVGGRAEELENA